MDIADSGTVISGTLLAIDPTGNTVTVEMAGNKITVNISAVQIDRTQLSNRIGGNIKLTGVSKKGKNFFASNIK